MLNTRSLNLIFFGPQGSGKGTQAKLLAKRFGLWHFASGDLLRATARTSTPLGRYLRRQMQGGSLTPIAKLLRVFDLHIKNVPRAAGVVFDGFARQITEARLFSQRLKKIHRQIDAAILVSISERETRKRLSRRGQCERCATIYILGKNRRLGGRCPKCGGRIVARSDDQPAAIHRRLALYRKRTVPVVRYFKQQGRLVVINGEQPIKKVHRDIVRELIKRDLIR